MTEFTGTQLALSALDCRTRNPASKAVALAAIRRHADDLGCTVEDVLAAAAGLLNGQVSAEDFRGGLHGQTRTTNETTLSRRSPNSPPMRLRRRQLR